MTTVIECVQIAELSCPMLMIREITLLQTFVIIVGQKCRILKRKRNNLTFYYITEWGIMSV